jgi:hypothetical protein
MHACMCVCVYVLLSSCNFVPMSFLAVRSSYPDFRASAFTLNVREIWTSKMFTLACRTTLCHNTGVRNSNKLFRTAGLACLLYLLVSLLHIAVTKFAIVRFEELGINMNPVIWKGLYDKHNWRAYKYFTIIWTLFSGGLLRECEFFMQTKLLDVSVLREHSTRSF